mgnify:FL=1
MTIQDQTKLNKLTEAMEKAVDPDFKKIWRRNIDYMRIKIDYVRIKHVEESVRKEGTN